MRLVLAFGLHWTEEEEKHPEPINIAISLAKTGEFANPFLWPTGPTAHTGPIYPAMVAPIYAFFGETAAARNARVTLTILAASAQYALMPYIALALGLGVWPGLIAGALGALVPLHYWPECMGQFETTWITLFLEVSTLLFLRFLASPSSQPRGALRGGAWWGLGCLLSPNVLPVLFVFFLLAFWRLRPGAAAVRWTAWFALAFFVVIAPWEIRNYVRMGSLFFIRDNFGLELFVSNRDGASAFEGTNVMSSQWKFIHPHSGRLLTQELIRKGEVAFYQERKRRAFEWIRSNPGQFASLTLERIRMFWLPEVKDPRRRPSQWAITFLGVAGLLLLARRNAFAAIVSFSILVSYSAIYSIVQNSIRYQHPVYWVLMLGTGWLAYAPLRRWLERPRANVLTASGA